MTFDEESARDEHSSERPAMGTSRVEAFSDGVIAVIITIMALNLHAPGGVGYDALRGRFPALAVYVLSFIFIGIYWNNHHHLFHRTERISGGVMWANLHLLFWLSLIPVVTEWIGSAYSHRLPAAIYGAICLGNALAYTLLTWAIKRANGRESDVATALGYGYKGRISLALYVAGIGLSAVSPYVGYACYACVSALWFIPDRRLVR